MVCLSGLVARVDPSGRSSMFQPSRRLQPPGQAQLLSRAMTALRIDSGMVSE